MDEAVLSQSRSCFDSRPLVDALADEAHDQEHRREFPAATPRPRPRQRGRQRRRRVNRVALRHCFEHAIRWLVPARPGDFELGLPTAHASEAMAQLAVADDPVVIPLPHGPMRGRAVHGIELRHF
jgi:hypothetical protein